ncbi:MAG TPA: sigma-70 family RNA polymerase sigma factor [Thermoanaerobaculia bacterium]|nr:sigma-70 family RNA polymerase sigma factor [Thermoanaerobaculia bacterium]
MRSTPVVPVVEPFDLPSPRTSSLPAHVRRTGKSEPPGWEAILVSNTPRLRAAIRRALERAGASPRPEDMEELVQESFCRLLDGGRLGACRGGEITLAKYVARLGERVALDRLRGTRTSKRGHRALLPLDRPGVGALAQRAVDPAANPEERLLSAEKRRHLFERVAALTGGRTPRRDARILTCALAGWTSAEISRACGGRLTPATVNTLLHRLRTKLAGHGFPLPGSCRGAGL